MYRINWERDMPTFLAAWRNLAFVLESALRLVRGMACWSYSAAGTIARPLWKPIREPVRLIILVTLVDALAGFVMILWANMEMVYLHAKGEPLAISDLRKLPLPDGNELLIPASVVHNREDWELDDNSDFRLRVEGYLSEDGYPKTARDWEKLHRGISLYKYNMSPVDRWMRHTNKYIWDDLLTHTDEYLDKICCDYAFSYQRIVLFYSVNALELAHQGNHKVAAKRILTGIQVDKSVCNAPLPIFFVSMCESTKHICKSVQLMAARDELDQSDMQEIYGALGQIDLNAVTPDRLRWVRAEGMESLRHKELHGYRTVIDWESYYWEAPSPLGRLYLAIPAHIEGFYLRPLTVLDRINYLHASDRYVSTCKQPYITLRGEVHREYESSKKLHWWNGFYTANFLKYFIVFLHYRDDSIAELGRTRVILAVHTYKKRFGRYPNTLDECRARLGWVLPQDPFSGEDFKYRRKGEGFDIYSVGRNLTDGIKKSAEEEYNPFMPYDTRGCL